MTFIRHDECPNCRRIGNDRSGNNLAIYSDGGSYCFACGYSTKSASLSRLKEIPRESRTTIHLPTDVDGDLPKKARDYLQQYALTELDIKKNVVLWSEYYQRVIFPYFSEQGLLAWQGRYLGLDKKAKWFSQGQLHEFFHIVGNKKADTVVLTEDVISAIKVGHCPAVCAIPLFGSHISTRRLLQLKLLYGNIFIWLDKDKQRDAVKFSNQARQFGLSSSTIITDLDPKEYTDNQIQGILNDFTNY